MNTPLLTELPYRADSAALFEAVADSPWSVWLDSGGHHPGQSRFDIIAAEPHTTLVTRGNLTEIRSDAIELSRDDPLALLREHLDVDRALDCGLPFSGGALGYFSYDLGRRFERMPALASDDEKMPEMAVGIYDWAVVVDHWERKIGPSPLDVLGWWPRPSFPAGAVREIPKVIHLKTPRQDWQPKRHKIWA